MSRSNNNPGDAFGQNAIKGGNWLGKVPSDINYTNLVTQHHLVAQTAHTGTLTVRAIRNFSPLLMTTITNEDLIRQFTDEDNRRSSSSTQGNGGTLRIASGGDLLLSANGNIILGDFNPNEFGEDNTAYGTNALMNISTTGGGDDNTAIGFQAMGAGPCFHNPQGDSAQNTAVGSLALPQIGPQSSNNTAIGFSSLRSLCLAQNNNTAVGSNAGNSVVGSISNTTLLGAFADTNQSGSITIGSNVSNTLPGSIAIGQSVGTFGDQANTLGLGITPVAAPSGPSAAQGLRIKLADGTTYIVPLFSS